MARSKTARERERAAADAPEAGEVSPAGTRTGGPRPSLRGRGAAHNPPNRFLPIHVDRDGWNDPDDPAPETQLLRDATRSIIARNDSPDVGFDASINPYRGCSHGCSYCMSPDTPVLMGDGSLRPVGSLEPGQEIMGSERREGRRLLIPTRVRDRWQTTKPAFRVELGDGTRLVAGEGHRLLTVGGWRFVGEPGGAAARGTPSSGAQPYTSVLTPGDRLMGIDDRATAVSSGPNREVATVERLGPMVLHDITTGTGDFIANGVVSHNCYARPGHEYLGMSAGLDFETKILMKEDAPALLRAELSSPGWKPQVLAMSGVTDPYQPAERRLEITRRCLEVLAQFRNPVAIITKSHLVTRDIDLLSELAAHCAARVTLSVTTLDRELQRVMEPRTAVPERRLDAIRRLAEAGIPVGVNVAPVIPGLTDHEMPAILAAAAEAGAERAGWVMLRLPWAVKELFEDWLERHFPDRKAKVLNRLRDLRGGELYDARYRVRQRGEGVFAEQVRRMFEIGCRRHGLNVDRSGLSAAAFRRPGVHEQLGLF